MKVLHLIDEYLEEYFLVTTLVVMVVVIFLQVVMRYVFQNSLSWSEELARYLFLWQVWVGASYATKKSRHLRVEILRDALPSLGQKILETLATLIWLAFAVLVVYLSYGITTKVMASSQITPALHLPMFIPYASVPVGMALMVFRVLQKLYLDIKKPVSRGV